MNDEHYMRIALEEARKAAGRDEVPVGAVLVRADNGEIIARDGNRTREYKDPSAHAEMLVIRKGCEHAGVQRLPDCDLYVTLEPCTMCAGVISFARIRTLHFAAGDEKGGAIIHGAQFFGQQTCHHRPLIKSGLLADEGGDILKQFFQKKRTAKQAD